MKITHSQLKKIIKEEIEKVLPEMFGRSSRPGGEGTPKLSLDSFKGLSKLGRTTSAKQPESTEQSEYTQKDLLSLMCFQLKEIKRQHKEGEVSFHSDVNIDEILSKKGCFP